MKGAFSSTLTLWLALVSKGRAEGFWKISSTPSMLAWSAVCWHVLSSVLLVQGLGSDIIVLMKEAIPRGLLELAHSVSQERAGEVLGIWSAVTQHI